MSNRKRLSGLALAASFVAGFLMGDPSTGASESSAKPPVVSGEVTVTNAAELEYMDQHLWKYLNKNIVLDANINLSGYEWGPFGGESGISLGIEPSSYEGTFNGRGHIITGVNIKGSGRLEFVFDGFGLSWSLVSNNRGLTGDLLAPSGIISCTYLKGEV